MGEGPAPAGQNASSFPDAGAAGLPVPPAHSGDKSGPPVYNFPHNGDTFLISLVLLNIITSTLIRIEKRPAGWRAR